MGEPIRVMGGKTADESNEQIQAQVDFNHNLRTIEGSIDGTNKTYEDASFVSGDSPATHDFYGDTGRIARDGYITCDGAGDILVNISRNGLTFDEQWTLKSDEITNLLRMKIKKIRVTHSGTDSSYRINLV